MPFQSTCLLCGVSFEARRSTRKYCSHKCYVSDKIRIHAVAEGFHRCSKCKEVKPIGSFYTAGLRKTPAACLARWCKACRCADERARRMDVVNVASFRARYQGDMQFRAQELLRGITKRCRRRGWAFDLDEEWLAAKLKDGHCEMTGLPFDMTVVPRCSTAYAPSVDRISPALGYTKANCRVVLYSVNVALFHWGIDVILPILEAIVRHQYRRKAS